MSDSSEFISLIEPLLREFSPAPSTPGHSWSISVVRTDGQHDAEPGLEMTSPFGDRPFASPDPDRHLDVFLRHVNRIKVISEPAHLHFHCAAIAQHGRVVLLSGESGAGKSTLAASLVSDGWAYLTDDQFAIHPTDGTISPHPRPIALRRAVWPEFADIARVPRPDDDGRLRVWITAGELRSGPSPDPSELSVGAIVAVDRRVTDPAMIKPAPLAATWRDLLVQSVDAGNLGVGGIAATLRHLGAVPAFALQYWNLQGTSAIVERTLRPAQPHAALEAPTYEPARRPTGRVNHGIVRGADVHGWRFGDGTTLLVRPDPFYVVALDAGARPLWDLLGEPITRAELLDGAAASSRRRDLRRWLEGLRSGGFLTEQGRET